MVENSMQGTIFEHFEFHKLEACCEKYMPLVSAIDENYSMERLGFYESTLSDGLFIHCRLELSIPTNGVYKELDVRSDEEILIFARSNYPFFAPAVLFVRNDFPTSQIPHLNLGIANTGIHLLNPCLYRGDINEWFYQNGPRMFCDRVNEWFSDLINGELMNGDGFETVRYENTAGYAEMDFDYLCKIISTYGKAHGAQVLQMKQKANRYFQVLNQEYSKKLSDDILPCIFVFDRENVVQDYISQALYTEKDLKVFPCECRIQHGIRKILGKYYEPKKIDPLKNILVVLAVKRPMQVLGSFSEYEFVAVLLSYDFRTSVNIENCPIKKVVPIQALNNTMAERLSGTENILKKPVVMLGCGALGSKISMNLARMGYTEQHFYDEDVILPHNLVRHYESGNYTVGFPKAEVMKTELDCMFSGNKSTSHTENIFFVDILPDGLVIDCTASRRILFWATLTDKIKSSVIRTEIYLGGKMGLTVIEGKNRNPDIYDMQVLLYREALDRPIISQWLNYKQPEDMSYHIGFGCSSDTTILDDGTISNHASVVPHLINKYQDTENGIACVNYFDRDDLTNNGVCIYEMEQMVFLEEVDGWSIHIRSSLYQTIHEYSNEKLENAGIWIGSIEKTIKRITIVDTFIPEDNDRKTNTVTMGKSGVKKCIKTLMAKTKGLLRYIGEWHTHTSGNASPSQRDLKTFDETQPSEEVFLMTILSPSNTRNYIIKRETR
jgi:hypothetical protein